MWRILVDEELIRGQCCWQGRDLIPKAYYSIETENGCVSCSSYAFVVMTGKEERKGRKREFGPSGNRIIRGGKLAFLNTHFYALGVTYSGPFAGMSKHPRDEAPDPLPSEVNLKKSPTMDPKEKLLEAVAKLNSDAQRQRKSPPRAGAPCERPRPG
jgi:hypothetical protein